MTTLALSLIVAFSLLVPRFARNEPIDKKGDKTTIEIIKEKQESRRNR